MLRWLMEKEKDMGLRYLMELGIRPARDKKGMYIQLKKQLGQREARSAYGAGLAGKRCTTFV